MRKNRGFRVVAYIKNEINDIKGAVVLQETLEGLSRRSKIFTDAYL